MRQHRILVEAQKHQAGEALGRDDWDWIIGRERARERKRPLELEGSVREVKRWERGERTNGSTPYIKYCNRTVERIRIKLEFKN